MMAICRVDNKVTDLCPLKDVYRHINTCLPKGPNLTVKICQSRDCAFVHFEDDIARSETRLFGWTP